MSDDKKPRFLQQTTSQLLHQQEALRRRREMLERESLKPPAMRFGTSTPPRTGGRPGRSPAPPSSSSATGERFAPEAGQSSSSSVHRELNWSRPEEERTVERAPMRFSMAFRPSPAPAMLARARATTAGHLAPSSPSPREVNTADQLDMSSSKLRRDRSSPRAVSPRSPVPQRTRLELARTPSENAEHGTDVREQNRTPGAVTAVSAAPATSSRSSSAGSTPTRRAVELLTDGATVRESAAEEPDDVTGIAAFSNTFAVPRFTPVSPVVASSAASRADEVPERVEEMSTPGRPAVGEFRTPRPVVRTSPGLATPTPRSDPSTESECDANVPGTAMEARSARRTTPSAAPALSDPPKSRNSGRRESAPAGRDVVSETPALPDTRSRAVSAAQPQRGSLSPSRPVMASPVPTTENLIHSVRVSAEVRPRGCGRTTPSPERHHHHHHHRATAAPSQTASPPPTPVSLTDGGQVPDPGVRHPRVRSEGPMPASLSSQPAGGEARVTVPYPISASPWPTTENIIQSILTGAGEVQRRRREGRARTGTGEATALEEADEAVEEADGASARFSNEEDDGASRESSPDATRPEPARTADAVGRDTLPDKGDSVGDTKACTPTPSPAPSERRYGQSILASVEKRRGGHPTPSHRHVSVTLSGGSCAALAESTSASPQPSTHHLLHSLDVSVEKGSPRERRADRAADSAKEASGAPDCRRAALRTPSPALTPEHVSASLQASAEKRMRSGAVVAASDPDATSSPEEATGSAHRSPELTPQNVKESVEKLIRDEHDHHPRSDAVAPSRPWPETPRTTTTTTTANTATTSADRSATAWNSSASPIVTAEDVDTTLRTLERDRRYASRSSRAPRVSDPSPEHSSTTPGRRSVVADTATSTGCEVEGLSSIAGPSADGAPLPSIVSPVPSEFAVASAMFFDCVSAPPTPAMAGAEEVAATAARAAAAVPQHFYDLQREVAAIAEGRGRTRTPPPLRASEQRSPQPAEATWTSSSSGAVVEAAAEDTAGVVARIEEVESRAVAAAAEADAAARRSSLILVHPTTPSQPLIQHPHQPMPTAAAPTISPVQVPRTPTPPPRRPPVSGGPLPAGDGHRGSVAAGGARRESPLPRPVSLRSQVALAKLGKSSHSQPHSRSPAQPSCGPVHAGELDGAPLAAHHHQHHHNQHEHAVASLRAEAEEQVDLFDPQNDWMDLVEPLRPHTITVSPHHGTVVCTTHITTGTPPRGDPVATVDGVSSPAASRKRSRSVQTPGEASPQTAVATPASIALTMDDGVSSGRKSSRVTATPDSRVSVTPRSSKRVRKSPLEELLQMLPADAAAEVLCMDTVATEEEEEEDEERSVARTTGASGDTLSFTGSPLGRLSSASDMDSTLGCASSISQRVAQRPQRVNRSHDDYIEYLEGIATSSAKKSRKVASRRTQRAVAQDLARVGLQPASQGGSGARSTGATMVPSTGSPRQRTGQDSQSATSAHSSSSSSSATTSSPASAPTPVTRGRQLAVSTRLSAELEKALFQQTPSSAAARRGQKRRASAKTKSPAVVATAATASERHKKRKTARRIVTAKSSRRWAKRRKT
ncbi:hypothetical protein NESM_000017700 [Novymonas esmeraldas]|uniref:Uncharacterized protein n=1 Tax=Novymonas esmeraldas TaxID=1808958 RepID=A0AAW0F1M0_9TRYP